ncbi:MAG: succinate dehydrogenase, hydrophobic membrane anchor protein [Alphaproteobacteria bacterium]|nr:succinate dehydrogenase, hydrophobic membrane anchor protein [Alphaproteobacteria bacterium]MCZ6589258.1 succinate dehydrogenase, hydrophobic membrane anchor protein [Alphaproteobacteria bacterium]MCZ6590782.1 succinate dehydrogenase, hydrophobic membrane anchor protein [Alphaproteobacteria bacterium]MCZ6839269.1 succinate dehydrogenase, hydrophobic membrane anchor protein [Alphaproteobacteria bacterium]MCZ6845039.1 succinate dehydrogenase, hydrophobic membrane anchor protein [Alphaproteobac
MSMRSPLGRARGLGSAKSGTQHWWAQRLTAIALVPLTIWFVIAMVAATGSDYTTARAFIGNPVTAVLLVLLIVATFHHAQLGLQVVIEDYVHTKSVEIALLLAIKGAAIVLALAAIFAVLSIAFGGA